MYNAKPMLDLLILNKYKTKCLSVEDMKKIYRKEKNVYRKMYEPEVNFKFTTVEFAYDEDVISLCYGNDFWIYKIIHLNDIMVKLVPYAIDDFTLDHHYIIIKHNSHFVMFLYYRDISIFKNILEPII